MSKSKVNDKKSFVMYDSFLEAMKHLNDTEFRECVMKIRDYTLDGINEESDSPMVNVIMAMAKPNLEAARRRYEISVENGKKGAEFGKLGGAPKGNQNARKKQPLNQPHKQPLDVDVEEDVNINENEEVDVNGDAPLRTIGSHSSFSNSSIGFIEEIENDSERLEEREEKKEPLQEVNQYHSNGCDVVSISEEEEILMNSNFEGNLVALDGPCIVEIENDAAARPQPKKEPGMDMSEYLHHCYDRNLYTLARMRMGEIPKDDALFWRTVDIHRQIFHCDDDKEAAKTINKMLTEATKGIV